MTNEPRVFGLLGVKRKTGETTHRWNFGGLEVGLAYIENLDGSPPRPVVWHVQKQSGTAHFNDGIVSSIPEATAAIESELRAIHAAIGLALDADGSPKGPGVFMARQTNLHAAQAYVGNALAYCKDPTVRANLETIGKLLENPTAPNDEEFK